MDASTKKYLWKYAKRGYSIWLGLRILEAKAAQSQARTSLVTPYILVSVFLCLNRSGSWVFQKALTRGIFPSTTRAACTWRIESLNRILTVTTCFNGSLCHIVFDCSHRCILVGSANRICRTCFCPGLSQRGRLPGRAQLYPRPEGCCGFGLERYFGELCSASCKHLRVPTFWRSLRR